MATTNNRFKTAIYEQFARIGKATSNPARLELLDLLSQGPRTVESLAREAGLGLTNASQHLKALRQTRLVDAEKSGLFVTYRLADDQVGHFLSALRLVAEARLAEVGDITRRFLDSRRGLEPVDRDRLIAKVRDGTVTVLDVRPAEEFRAGHLPGAVSIPLRELEPRLRELPRKRAVVAYCRGPYCVLAIEAVEMLRANGFTAYRLEDGVRDWQARGYAVATGDERGRRRARLRRKGVSWKTA
jgi:rhodanese-related sulfurtransferase